MLPSVQSQVDRVLEDYPDAKVTEQSDGQLHLEVPNIPLPGGWNKSQIRVLVIVPVGYPTTKLGGFFADRDLRLANGDNPKGASESSVGGTTWLAFCWSSETWDHDRETLWRYIKFVESRFQE